MGGFLQGGMGIHELYPKIDQQFIKFFVFFHFVSQLFHCVSCHHNLAMGSFKHNNQNIQVINVVTCIQCKSPIYVWNLNIFCIEFKVAYKHHGAINSTFWKTKKWAMLQRLALNFLGHPFLSTTSSTIHLSSFSSHTLHFVAIKSCK
jgi:hypothetical protein